MVNFIKSAGDSYRGDVAVTNELTEALVDGMKAAEMSLSEFCAACGLSEQLFRQVLESDSKLC